MSTSRTSDSNPGYVKGLSHIGVSVNQRQREALERLGSQGLLNSLANIPPASSGRNGTDRTSSIPGFHEGTGTSNRSRERTNSNISSISGGHEGKRSFDDEHPIFNRPCGHVVEKATEYDVGVSSGGYFDERGNPLLRISRHKGDGDKLSNAGCQWKTTGRRASRGVGFKNREHYQKDDRYRERQRYAKGWGRTLNSRVPLGSSEIFGERRVPLDEDFMKRKPTIAIARQRRELLNGESVRSCLSHTKRPGEGTGKDDATVARHLRRSNPTVEDEDAKKKRSKGPGSHVAFVHARRPNDEAWIPREVLTDRTQTEDAKEESASQAKMRGTMRTNGSVSVARAISQNKSDRAPTHSRFKQKRHYIGVGDYRQTQTPPGLTKTTRSREISKNLQILRDTLPKGKAQAHRVLVHTFRKMDLDFNGQVNCTSFKRAMSTLGVNWNRKQIQSVLRDSDRSRSGFVDYNIFADKVVALTSKKSPESKSRKHVESDRRWDRYKTSWANQRGRANIITGESRHDSSISRTKPKADETNKSGGVRILHYTKHPPRN